ncbi:uncharacterized protein LOC136076440 isoform X2 [Hydra vulgaris]|uniref:Uncharacterized protein LOC136076440 isoform X2 n=1 Tax=Hydra vulgaris TaxID=6087 RepID=A0ABM4BAH1_HYDVU
MKVIHVIGKQHQNDYPLHYLLLKFMAICLVKYHSDFNMPTSLQQAVISTSTPGSQPLLPIPHHANVFREMQHQGKSSQSFVSLLNDPDEINLLSEFLPIPYTKNSTNTLTPITQSSEYRLSSIENLLKGEKSFKVHILICLSFKYL